LEVVKFKGPNVGLRRINTEWTHLILSVSKSKQGFTWTGQNSSNTAISSVLSRRMKAVIDAILLWT
jgi:hypothetical protein